MVCLKIKADPKKPTPEGIAAETREESQDMGPLKNANVEQILNKHEPKDTSAMVRIPAGLSAFRRSHPIKQPKTVAQTRRRPF